MIGTIRQRFCGDVALLLAGLAVALLWASDSFAQSRWPIKDFEVLDGPPQRTGHHYEAPDPFRASLTPALRQEIERYFGEVAHYLERVGFPPPQLDPVVTRRDGRRAYRIYYYKFDAVGGLNENAFALYRYTCEGESARRLIRVNALKLTGPDGRITDKGYGDLAHELFHAVQRSTAFFRRNCEPPNWITEGQAEAVGHDLARLLRGVKSNDAPKYRWGQRWYFTRFATDNPSDAYQTSSFWRYLAELEHSYARKAPPPARPGPEFDVPGYGTDYSVLLRFLQSSDEVTNHSQGIQWLDRQLKADASIKASFAQVYTNFITAYAAYGRHRMATDKYDEWLEETLSRCPKLMISAARRSAGARLSFGRITSRCVRLSTGDIGPQMLSVDIRTIVPSAAIGGQLFMGVVGEDLLAPAIVTDDTVDGNVIASWSLGVKLLDSVDLVFMNVAPENPSGTLEVELDIGIAMAGWESNLQTKAAADRVPRAATTRRGAAPAAPVDAALLTDGTGSARAERDDAGPPAGCSWPERDFAAHCGPWLRIRLQTVAAALAGFGSVVDSGGVLSQALATMERLEGGPGAVGMAGLHASNALSVSIAIPLPDYGYAGRFDNAVIRVAGDGLPERGAYGPKDLLDGSQTYFPPIGRVEIEAYSLTELRGSFEAVLVELPLPLGHRESHPTLPTAGTISGRFLVTRPWEGDPRFETVRPPMQIHFDDIAERMPRAFDPPVDANAPAPPGSPPAAQGDEPHLQEAGAACDCSCAEYRRVFAVMSAMDELSDGSSPSTDQIRLVMCTLACGAAYARCDAGN